MDKLNWKILRVLDWKGREPTNKIAKAVKSNKDVVAYRIKKLEEKGIIVRYYPVLDMYKLGYNTSRLYFDLEEIGEEQEKKFLEFLDKEMKAGLIFRMDYPYRYGIFLWVRSVYDVQDALVKIKRWLGKALIKYNHSLICTFRQYPKDYMFGEERHETYRSLEPVEMISYDENDFKILKELSKDARLSTVQIAKNLKIPQTTVSAKIKNLEKKKIIQGYRAEIDFIKLGFMNYFLEIYLETNENLSQIESWANAHRNVVWLQKIIGTCDIEIEMEVKDRVELESLLNELRAKFKNIRKIVFWSQEYKKLTYLPSKSGGST
ncbi:Lrp/AsnC family transcriptional regulator [Candidatus Woesearchaeota archaeon]|nr:Lrp/AsnC family transcriptional regulator [Candidatus Woesearchaeota archaeon]MBI5148530.1 Lrp/AsnC family transcriptional regulator [Candidatus Pacearchaeota archaeon]